jgi:hypothetical protein
MLVRVWIVSVNSVATPPKTWEVALVTVTTKLVETDVSVTGITLVSTVVVVENCPVVRIPPVVVVVLV